MDARTLGTSATSVSVIGLGCNNFGMKLDAAASAAVVHAALDAGVSHFDTAEMYGGGQSEEFLGRALAARRDDVVIATKFSPRSAEEPYRPGALARRIREGCESSLRRLGTDRIDLYYQHYPDADAPVDEALDTTQSLVTEGKVLQLGSSNVTAELVRRAGSAVAATQIEWNLLSRSVEDEIVPAARAEGVSVIPYFPLASGLLTGKYRSGTAFPTGSRFDTMPYFASVATPENLARVEALLAFADARGHTLLELAVAWLLAQDSVASVICGATSPAQVIANSDAVHWRLGAEDLTEIDACLAAT